MLSLLTVTVCHSVSTIPCLDGPSLCSAKSPHHEDPQGRSCTLDVAIPWSIYISTMNTMIVASSTSPSTFPPFLRRRRRRRDRPSIFPTRYHMPILNRKSSTTSQPSSSTKWKKFSPTLAEESMCEGLQYWRDASRCCLSYCRIGRCGSVYSCIA